MMKLITITILPEASAENTPQAPKQRKVFIHSFSPLP